jgi:hypothetical protein
MGDGKCIGNVVGKTAGKTQLGRPRHRWEYNIKINTKEIGCEGVD